ncbi:MAG: S8 family serine peptidase, partial [Sedimentisphaerales bacterium]|nr:S8 family serine peptidase [Sedimentisphaerales bacterium]
LTVNDGLADSAADTVQISTLNTPPVADAGSGREVLVGALVSLDGSGSTDADQDILSYVWSFISKPTGSTAEISSPASANPSFTADAVGTYIIQLIVSDGIENSNPDSVFIEALAPANQPPSTAGDAYTIDEDTRLVIGAPGVLENDYDPEGEPLTATLQTTPSQGEANLDSNGAFTYTPAPDYSGPDSFTYVADDGTLESGPTTVDISVQPVNDPPAIMSSPPSNAAIDVPFTYDVSASDPDEGDGLVYSLEAAPEGMNMDPETGTITWTPTESQVGPHQVIVRVEDRAGLSAQQEFILIVSPLDECGPGAINVCGRCVPFTPIFAEMSQPPSDEKIKAVQNKMGGIELPFVANLGQEDARVGYYTATAAGNIYVTRDGRLVYSLRPSETDRDKEANHQGWTLTETVVNGNPDIAGKESTAARTSYFRGNDRRSWKKDVPTYAAVSLGEVWPGIQVHLKARSRTVEKVFTVSPKANVDAIRLRIDGAKSLNLAENGTLRIETGLGDVTLTKPVAWQEKEGGKEPVLVAYSIAGDNSYGFTLGPHDPHAPVVIDPLLQATYIGGSLTEWGSDIAIHPTTGDIYVTGMTISTDFPGTEGGAQDSYYAESGYSDLFIVRLSEDLTTLLQATFLGGSNRENWLPNIAIHPHSGDIYISGVTRSDDFPATADGAQPSFSGWIDDVFVARLNAELTTLLQATYLGGSYNEGYSNYVSRAPLVIHPVSGDIYVAGYTASFDFPGTEGGAQAFHDSMSASDGFLVRLTADLQNIIQSSYLGGNGNEAIETIVVHPVSGDILAAGTTYSTDFPGTAGGYQETLGGDKDGFVACLNEDLTQLLQSTYAGSNDSSPGFAGDDIYGMAVHPFSGDIYLAGRTDSRDYSGAAGGAIPALDPNTLSAGAAGILLRMSPDLASVRQATYLSGPAGGSIALDVKAHPVSGDIYATGPVNGPTFPGVEGGVQIGRCGYQPEGFVAKLSQDLTRLFQATYVGGNYEEDIEALAIHPATGDLYIAGSTVSGNLPGTEGGACESDPSPIRSSAFAARITPDLQGEPFNEPPSILPNPMPEILVGETLNYQVEVTDPNTRDCIEYQLLEYPSGGMLIDGNTGIITYTPSYYSYQGDHTVTVRVVDGGGLEDTHSFTLTVVQPPTAPTFTSTPITTATVDKRYTYSPRATDQNYDPLVYSLDVAPAGMMISGYIWWTPTRGDVGVHEIVVRATDPGGLFATQRYYLTVNPPIVSVPNVVGQTQADAEAAVTAANLTVGTVTAAYSDTVPAGSVISQNPPAGTSAAEGSPIDLVVSLGDTGEADEDRDGFTINGGDCDDTNADIHPDATDIAGNGIDENCDGADAVTSIRMDTGMDVVRIPLGTSRNLGFTFNFDAVGLDTYNLTMHQEVLPDTGGITIAPDLPAVVTTTGTKGMYVGQTFTGNTVGTYEVISSIAVDETGQTAQVAIQVEVTEGDDVPILKPLGAMPDAIPLSTTTDVMFKTIVAKTRQAPETITVEEVDGTGNIVRVLGSLVDDGSAGDILAGDQVYSGTFPVNAPDSDGILRFRAVATFSGVTGTFYSEACEVAATRFATDFVLTNPSSIVTDPQSGALFVSNRIILAFAPGTDADTIETIVDSVDGSVIGIMHSIGLYSVEIPDTENGTGVSSALAALQSYPEVEIAEAVHLAAMTAVVPNDGKYPLQDALTNARVEEAWVMARGAGVLVAIVDTGIDFQHPDLDDKQIINQFERTNLVDGPGEDPMFPQDFEGHGTLVAGTAAAETDNDIGIAGTAWSSHFYPIRACRWIPSRSGSFCENDVLARGILHAAKVGARVINLSEGGYENDGSLRLAVEHAHFQGSLLVAAAGNDNRNNPFYPAAYDQVLAVGAIMTDPDDVDKFGLRWEESPTKGSNHGNWVDIAARGQNVMSTIPIDPVADPSIDLDVYCPNEQQRGIEGCYMAASGTSMATPIVSGAAALLWSVNPEWENEEIRERLERTAFPLTDPGLGEGGLDIFEAIFNGSFEMGGLYEWNATAQTGNPPSASYDPPIADSVSRLGQLEPPYNPDPTIRRNPNRRMALIGNDGPDRTRTTLSRTFYVQPGVVETYLSFDYTFVTEEFPDYYSINCPYFDYLSVSVAGPSGTNVYSMHRDLMSFTSDQYHSFYDYSLDIGELGLDTHPYDLNYRQCPIVFDNSTTGVVYQHVNGIHISFDEGPGFYTISFSISDSYDAVGDSVLLIDNIRFKEFY